jgi:hypothetical protein
VTAGQGSDIGPEFLADKLADEGMFEVPGYRLRQLTEEAKVASATGEILRQALLAIAQNAHVHDWAILGVWKPASRPVHPRGPIAAETVVLIKCRGCGLPESVSLDGDFTEEQVRKDIAKERISERVESGETE